ncbi:MAG TPA: NAD(P)-dependent oxidoreductase [Oligoflexia bacterium]|nr:NAD(P)-dependent oxidoreductase [Oligoflexia bacterium]HMR23803.1 NAD(P)-dependent oxidoreductase [Oligoflexia bacterium]
MKRKVLLIGGSGFIGKHFSMELSDCDIHIADLEQPELDQKYKHYSFLDIREKDQVFKFFEKNQTFDDVILLAAEHKDFGVEPEAYYKTNVDGTKNVLDALNEKNTKTFTFFSSVAIYGEASLARSEEDEKNPVNHYGKSKLQAEQVVLDWKKNTSIKTVIVRPAVVYGEKNVANMYKLIQQIKKKKFFYVGAMNNIKSICYVKNLVSACMFVLRDLEEDLFIFNYADDKQMTSREISQTIAGKLDIKLVNVPLWLVYCLAIPFDLLTILTKKDFGVSTQRIKKLCTQTYFKAEKIKSTGYKAKYNNKDGIEAMVDWLMKS